MRVGIDMIGGQSPHSRERGIGRYTLNLVQTLLECDDHEYVLYLHGGLERPAFDPGKRATEIVLESPSGRAAGRVLNEVAEANPDRLDWLLVTSPADMSSGYFAPRPAAFGPRMATAVYDLIPLLFPETVAFSSRERARYHRSLEHLKRYDVLLASSLATVADCRRYLAIDGERLKVAYPGSDAAFFSPAAPCGACGYDALVDAAEGARCLRALGVTGPFVFTVSGTLEHKNLAGLLAAFSRLPEAIRQAYQLVVTCAIHPAWEEETRRKAQSLGILDRLVLTNYVDDATLRALYRRCGAFVFPSRYEGFGLPLVEAMQCGAPVLAGRNSSQIEVVGDAGALVMVDDQTEMAAQLGRMLTDRAYVADLRNRAVERGRQFDWRETARAALGAIEGATRQSRALHAPRRPSVRRSRPRIAFLSPLPPSNSGIAEYSTNLVQSLQEHCTIDLFHDDLCRPLADHATADFECFDHRLLPRLLRMRSYRQVVHQMGNSLDHRFVYEAILSHGGLLVLHDTYLPDFHFGYDLKTNAGLMHVAREVEACSPEWADEFRSNRQTWEKESGGLSGACLRRGITFTGSVLNRADAVIVHDPWSRDNIIAKFPRLADRVIVVPHGARTYDVSPERRRAVRARFGLPHDALLLGSFGNLQWHKCNEEAIEAFAAISRMRPDVELFFVGRDVGHGAARAKAAALGLEHRVHFVGYASREEFIELAATTDIAINLRRPPTHGETSGALLILLGAGVPTVVTDVDTFSSYPESVVRKIIWGESPVATLQQALSELIASPDQRRQLGRAAQEYVNRRHDWDRVAAQYAEALEAHSRQAGDARATLGVGRSCAGSAA